MLGFVALRDLGKLLSAFTPAAQAQRHISA
jgi:hypothetical protein